MNLSSNLGPLCLALLAGCATAGAPDPRDLAAVPTTYLAALGQSFATRGAVLTPLAVIEDSRCPAGVQCIQAGTVWLQMRVVRGRARELVTLGLGKPAPLGDRFLHLLRACPYPQHSNRAEPGAYRFAFAVTEDSVPAEPAPACA